MTGWPRPPQQAQTTKTSRYSCDLATFVTRTKIEVPHDVGAAIVPFAPWPAQLGALEVMERERLLAFLKARQLGISWLICAFALHQCVTQDAQTWLIFSQGQLEANELIRRVGFLHDHHQDRERWGVSLTKDNTDEWAWSNGSRVRSLPATRRAGRSFTASGVILDEFAFMMWGPSLLAAVKPTIDAGGKLFIISSADGAGSAYHQLIQGAEAGTNGFRLHFLPWGARPDRGEGWRERIIAESPELTRADVLREYPENVHEAFTHAAGLIYGDVWRDGPEGGNVTEAADYLPGLDVSWAVDDGYAGAVDKLTGTFTASSHPRVFLLVQERPDGTICVFDEDYRIETLEGEHIAAVLAKPYSEPSVAVVDKSAAALKGHLHAAGVATISKAPGVEESIKVLRGLLAPDKNKRRRILVHPRCRHLRAELAAYRKTPDGKVVKAFDHGPDALRYFAWIKRHEATE